MPASVLSISLALAALFSEPVLAAYVLETTYDNTNLFTDFNFSTMASRSELAAVSQMDRMERRLILLVEVFYAMEWLPSSIKVWFFSRGSIPADITSGNPSPSTWGPSVLNVGSTCDIDAHFRNMRVVIDTTFCGDWAGDKNVWEQTSCYLQNPVPENTCANYVKNNPQAYQEGYWDFKSIKVYNAPGPDTGGEDGSVSEASPPDASVSLPIITPISEFIPQGTPVSAGEEPTNYFGLDSEPTFSQLAVSPKPNPGEGRGACRAHYPTAPPPIETNQGTNLETGTPETDYLQASPGLRVVVSMALGILFLSKD
ncbi:hypothetical protein B0O99DRAFT_590704 [Bisporella sp. PMI_857]|nr:hypothetical protein B0O99DRAFT_590704 [Bisporella sp. PMI_857]